MTSSRLTLQNTLERNLLLILEPWAEEYVLPPGTFVEILADLEHAQGDFEVSISSDHVVVTGWAGGVLRVFADGVEMAQRDQRQSWE